MGLTGLEQAPARRDPGAQRLEALVHLAAFVTMAVGAGVLLGWWLDVPRLRQPLRGLPAMVPNTALAFLASGLGLELALRPSVPRWLRLACAALTAAIGAVTLAEYAAGASFGVDDLLAEGPGNPELGLRPSPNTALNFVFLAAVMAAREAGPRGRRLADGLTLIVMLVSLLVLAGYVYDATPLYVSLPGVPEPTGMAVHTAFGFLMVCGGFLCVPPSEAARLLTSPYAGGVVARRLVAAAVAMPALGLVVMVGHWAGWYSQPSGAAILAVASLALAGGLILPVVRALDASDAALRASEERQRALIEQASEGIFLADREGRYTEVNAAGCAMLGYRRDELVGRTIADLLPAGDLERFEQHRRSVFEGAVEVSAWQLRRKDGGFVPVEVSAKLLADGRWQAFVRDIRERKAAEAALVEAAATERRLRARLEAVTTASVAVSEAVAALPGDGIDTVLHTIALQAQLLTGADFVAVGMGGEADRRFAPWVVVGVDAERSSRVGAPPHPVGILGVVAREGQELRLEDLRNHPAFGGFPPHHPEMASFLGVPVRHRGHTVGNLYLANRPGGRAFSDDDLGVVRMLAARAGLAIETAHLYQTEASQRTWLQHVIDQMPEGVLLYDGAGRLLQRNAAARNLAGSVEAAPELCAPAGDLLPAGEQPAERARHGENVSGVELVVRRPDGELVPVLVSATPIRPRGAVVVLRDIRTYKEIERLREEWASVIAHDLRQPVSSILLNLDVAERKAGDEQRRSLERIRTTARRLGRMIGDLSDLSQIEARRLRVSPRRLDLAELVRDLAVRLGEVAGGHEVRVAWSEALPVRADPDRMEQVLGNLVSNAAKYGDPRTPICVEVTRAGAHAEVAVTNQGRGIAPAELPMIWSRFGRTRGARESGQQGLGLGLYICKGLVEAQGGTIGAESAPAGPTTFRIRLPIVESLASPVLPES